MFTINTRQRFQTCQVLLLLTFVGIDARGGEWQPLIPDVVPDRDAIAGEWKRQGDSLLVAAAASARLSLPATPTGEYDFRVSFTRLSGAHSIALIFVHGGRQATLEVDAWGRHLSGLQSIGGNDLRRNATRRENMRLENNRRYVLLVEVRNDRIRGLLDDEVIAEHRTDGSDLGVVAAWRMPEPMRLGIGAWDAETVFHTVEVRSVGDAPLSVARTQPPMAAASPARPLEMKRSTSDALTGSARGKRVLIVIANQDFFYREYGDPREELERAGVKVTVAAGRKAPCRPHRNSGEGRDGGVVRPDVALAGVRAEDYDAILFSGGWGASAYQYAFNGRYSNATYNGDRKVKQQVNRLINEFLAQDKYVCALCNGVSVLAWARVDGISPLQGKHVCAPVREAAAGIYNGRRAQPSCRWHPEMNGAILSPPGAVGNPRTNTDDVLVDGRIVTGEDDPSAREMGRTLARMLAE